MVVFARCCVSLGGDSTPEDWPQRAGRIGIAGSTKSGPSDCRDVIALWSVKLGLGDSDTIIVRNPVFVAETKS